MSTTKQFLLRKIPIEIHRAIKHLATDKDKSMEALIIEAVVEYLKNEVHR